jgi:anthranilate/para-aminobenzoate synthase component II
MGSSATSSSTSSADGVRVVVVDHHDSYTFNLVHLIASVTGVLPPVVEHDAVAASDLLDGRFTQCARSAPSRCRT